MGASLSLMLLGWDSEQPEGLWQVQLCSHVGNLGMTEAGGDGMLGDNLSLTLLQ